MIQKNDNVDLDFLKILSKLLFNKSLIIKITFLFFSLGLIFSLSKKNYFTSSTSFYPHIENIDDGSLNNIKNLAGIAGISLGSNNGFSELPTSLYPELVKSSEFKNELLYLKITLDDEEILFKNYLINNAEFSFIDFFLTTLNHIRNLFFTNDFTELNKNPDLKYISKEDYQLHKLLNKKIKISIKEKEQFILLSYTDINPEISAIIATKSKEILQRNIIDFKLKNIKDLYNFTTNQLSLAKKNYFNIQDSLANFKDSNLSIKSVKFSNLLERLETENNISKNIYNELALAKEKTEIDVRKNTPIFTIINPVYVPTKKSGPNRALIVTIFLTLGLIFGSMYVLFKDSTKVIIKEIYKN